MITEKINNSHGIGSINNVKWATYEKQSTDSVKSLL